MADEAALIFGGTSGIGLACARALTDAGMTVTIAGRDAARAAAAAASVGGAASGRQADATSDEAVAALFASMPAPAHVVASLAGGSALGPFAELDDAAWRRSLEIKLFANAAIARHALRALPARGSLTFVTGVAGMRPAPGAACLAVANMAVAALVETLAVEAAPVRVNAVAPGTTDTPAWERMPAEARRSMFDGLAARTPLGRIGRPEDAAALVRAIVTHPFLTGLVIPCDGGLRLA